MALTMQSETAAKEQTTAQAESIAEGAQGSSLFSNTFETHTPDDTASVVSLNWWDSSEHKDLRGQNYKDTGGLHLSIFNMFNAMGSGISNPIVSEIHLVLNPDYRGDKFFSGEIVVESDSAGSKASANISILVDGDLVWQSDAPITGSSIEPASFEIDLTNAKNDVIIKTECTPSGNGLKLGIVNLSKTAK